MKAVLFLYPTTITTDAVNYDFPVTLLDSSPAKAQEQLCSTDAEFFVFWDDRIGTFDPAWLLAFQAAKDDIWHMGYSHDPYDLLRFIDPGSVYRFPAPPTVDRHVNWRIDLRCAIVRKQTMDQLGGLSSQFDTLPGAAWEMGWRWLKHGGIIRQLPSLFPCQQEALFPSLTDYYRLVCMHQGLRIAQYIAARRMLQGHTPWTEIHACRCALHISPNNNLKMLQDVGTRDISTVVLLSSPKVSVVLPTYGRYKYIAEVLEDLRSQTIRPTQILIADANQVREPQIYAQFTDLPLDVLWLPPEQNGTCKSRNACLERATGDYIWFVDDDSRLGSDNLENHLRLLEVYGADVSVGPAYTKERPELHTFQREITCTFMDCGTTVVRSALLRQVGGFDVQFNESLPGEDGEIGDRFIRAGGLMLNNPYAQRFHYLAPIGGARSSPNNPHRWRRWNLRPRPTESIFYRAMRHLDLASAREAVFITWFLIGWRKRGGNRKDSYYWLLKTFFFESIALPISLIRLLRSLIISHQMLRKGPQIPVLGQENPP